MTAFETLLHDNSFRFLREQWHAESAVKIHKRGGKKAAGAHTGGFHRIITDYFIRWLPVLDEDGRPMLDDKGRLVKTHRPPRTTSEPDEFAMPAHEAMKRERPSGESLAPDYRWLRETVAWRYLPCACNCADVVAHIAQRDRTTADNVVTCVIAAARRALMFLGAHDALPADLKFVPRPQGSKSAVWSSRAATPTDLELARLPRTYWPCGCDELTIRCEDHRASSATAA